MIRYVPIEGLDMLSALEMAAGYFERAIRNGTAKDCDTTWAVREAIEKAKMPCQPTGDPGGGS